MTMNLVERIRYRLQKQSPEDRHADEVYFAKFTPVTCSMVVYFRQKYRFRRVDFKRGYLEFRGSIALIYELESGVDVAEVPSSKIILLNLKSLLKFKRQFKRRSTTRCISIKQRAWGPSLEIQMASEDHIEQVVALYHQARHPTCVLENYEFVEKVGKGASGRVFHVVDVATRRPAALKVIDKKTLDFTPNSYRHALHERTMLKLLAGHPLILQMQYTAQTKRFLYVMTEYCEGGDLFELLTASPKPIPECDARIVAAEIIAAIDTVHRVGAMYRDVKLENILLDGDGHIRLADFGLSKIVMEGAQLGYQKTGTFCGTREYVAPEMLKENYYSKAIDFWAYGILLYELICGRTPFVCADPKNTYSAIKNATVNFPDTISDEIKDLICSLLRKDPDLRLGMGSDGINEIKNHPWFLGIDWCDAENRNLDTSGIRMRMANNRLAKEYDERLELLNGKDSHRRASDARREAEVQSVKSDMVRTRQVIKIPSGWKRFGKKLSFWNRRNREVVPGYSHDFDAMIADRSTGVDAYVSKGHYPPNGQNISDDEEEGMTYSKVVAEIHFD